MKKWIVLFSGFLLFASIVLFPSCSTKEATTGLLIIKVMDSNGEVVVGEQVYLATSYQNLQSGTYIGNKWTDQNGNVLFTDLVPGVYWYDTEHWEDYGAVQVYAGFDHMVILWVNTPQP
ncbi:MAG: carboxypeptidase regulatory-like domain-containing protein [Bacteroidetes bacterium]|nr:MAG: carboxypeptidase regulatory-like domain-containing protein [Bacteroidota bacterium]